MHAAAGGAARAAQLLDALLRDMAPSVRPSLEEEVARGQPKRAGPIRRKAEALLAAAERACAPAFRQQHAELWPALAAELDARLTEACYKSIGSDDDTSDLWSWVGAGGG